MTIRTILLAALSVSITSVAAIGCGSGEPGAPGAQTDGTVLASVTTDDGHIFEFVELKAGDVLVGESIPVGAAPKLGVDSRTMSLGDVYRRLAPGQTVPEAIVSADARVVAARNTYVPSARSEAPDGPAPNPAAGVKFYDGFYDLFCAPTNSVNCFEGKTGTLTGSWVNDVWFQTAGMVDGRSPSGTNATLKLNEWVSGVEKTIYSRLIPPGNYWYLTRWTLPPSYHRGILAANSTATMTSFAEQSEDLLVNVPLDRQLESYWCWAATAQMVMQYFGVTVSQCTQANALFGRTDCCQNPSSSACNKPGNPPFDKYGFSLSYTQWGTALSFAQIVAEVEAGRPITHQIQWTDHAHFVVVTGAYTQNGKQYVVINDPEGSTAPQLYSDYVSGSGYFTGADQYAFKKN